MRTFRSELIIKDGLGVLHEFAYTFQDMMLTEIVSQTMADAAKALIVEAGKCNGPYRVQKITITAIEPANEN